MTAKAELRRLALAARAAAPDREARSVRIGEQVLALPEYAAARAVAAYVGVGDEVATSDLIVAALADGKRVAVPWCDGDELRLTWIEGLDDLAPAPFGLLEPPSDVRIRPERVMQPRSADLLLVPGVAFDRRGARVGHGRGYYDRLLRRCRPDAARVALGFECQVFDQVPAGAGDEPVDCLVTEARVYRFTARAAWPAP